MKKVLFGVAAVLIIIVGFCGEAIRERLPYSRYMR